MLQVIQDVLTFALADPLGVKLAPELLEQLGLSFGEFVIAKGVDELLVADMAVAVDVVVGVQLLEVILAGEESVEKERIEG